MNNLSRTIIMADPSLYCRMKSTNRLILSVLSLINLCVSGVPTLGKYYTDEGARRLVHFDRHSGDCKLFGDR